MLLPLSISAKVCAAIFAFSSLSTAVPSSQPSTAHRLQKRASIKKYYALGDSYASGIAAGDYVDPKVLSPDWVCSRFTNAYARQLNALLDGVDGRELLHLGCSGKTTSDVQKDQKVGNDADLVTLSVGANDLDFAPIADACIYHFTMSSSRCAGALDKIEAKINGPLFNQLWNTIFTIRSAVGTSNPDFRLMVLNYPKFWNDKTDQCDNVSFFWLSSRIGNRMTKADRKRMNDMSDKFNAVIKNVVDNWNDPKNDNVDLRVHLVNIDSTFENHRFCENKFVEPDKGSELRPDQWIFQLGTPLAGNLDGNETEPGKGIMPSLQLPPELDPPDTPGVTGGLPLFISKIFHPTTNGHAAIAAKIKSVYEATFPPPPGQQFDGPNQFCQCLAPGCGPAQETCTIIPAGCHIIVPADNTVPEVQC